MTQYSALLAPVVIEEPSKSNAGVIAAVVAVGIVVIALIVIVAFVLKKHLVRRGKLYMDGFSVCITMLS